MSVVVNVARQGEETPRPTKIALAEGQSAWPVPAGNDRAKSSAATSAARLGLRRRAPRSALGRFHNHHRNTGLADACWAASARGQGARHPLGGVERRATPPAPPGDPPRARTLLDAGEARRQRSASTWPLLTDDVHLDQGLPRQARPGQRTPARPDLPRPRATAPSGLLKDLVMQIAPSRRASAVERRNGLWPSLPPKARDKDKQPAASLAGTRPPPRFFSGAARANKAAGEPRPVRRQMGLEALVEATMASSRTSPSAGPQPGGGGRRRPHRTG